MALFAKAQQLPDAFRKMNGILSNVVYCIFQDKKGYIWVGTEAGVSRYDGYTFRNFSKDDGLSDNDIFQIKEDNKGRIWFLTYNGQPTIYDNGRILTPKNCSFLSKVVPGSMATGFIEKGDSISYITMNKAYLFYKDSLVKVTNANDEFSPTGFSFFLYGANYNNNFYYFTQKGYKKEFESKLTLYPGNMVQSSLSSKMMLIGNQLICTGNGATYVLDMKTLVVTAHKLPEGTLPISLWPGLQTGVLWVFTNKDFYFLRLYEKTLERYTGEKLPSITTLLYDREGNSWMGSLTNGLYFSGNYHTRYFNYTTTAGTKTAYSLQVFKDVVYAGYANAEFAGCNKRGLEIESLSSKQYVTPPRVYGFFAGLQSLWVAAGNRLIEISENGRLIHEITGSTKAIFVHREKELYVALSYNVIKLQLDTMSRITSVLSITNSKPVYNGRVNHFYSNNSDTILMGALTGLVMMVKDSIIQNAFPDKPVFNTTVTKVIGTKYGIAFSTLGEGIAIMAKDSLYVLNKNNGLVNNACNSLFSSGDTLWVATTMGLSRIIITNTSGRLSFQFKNYSESNGFPSSKINDVLVYKDTVWVATENGVCSIDARSTGSVFPPPDIVIEEMLVNGQRVDWQKSLLLVHDSNNIRLRFTGISFFSNGNITYKYKLEGADEKWNTTTSRDVEYPALPPGKYRFLVMAANADGVWNEKAIKIDFEITPPYWKTWWFRLLIIVGCVSLFMIIARYRFVQQKQRHEFQKKNLILEKEKTEFEMENINYEKQLIELEQQALRLQMNPHFIFNAITAIQGLYAGNKPTAAKDYLVRFSRLLRTLFETARVPIVPLSKELELVTDYIELSIPRLDHNIQYSIEVQEGIVSEDTGIAPMLLQPFIENALLHGLLPLKREGSIRLNVVKKDEMLIFTIEDNGVGRQENPAHRLGRPHGLSITQKRIDLLNGIDNKAGNLLIEDLKDEQGIPIGTRVTFNTKFIILHDQDHYS